jgi:hypothetical protein
VEVTQLPNASGQKGAAGDAASLTFALGCGGGAIRGRVLNAFRQVGFYGLVRVRDRSGSERRGGRVTSLAGARRPPNGDPMDGPSLLFSLLRSRQRTGAKDASVGRTGACN